MMGAQTTIALATAVEDACSQRPLEITFDRVDLVLDFAHMETIVM
ncbi:MAG: hypothetical protein RRZ24_10590 [Clostridia bacterium]